MKNRASTTVRLTAAFLAVTLAAPACGGGTMGGIWSLLLVQGEVAARYGPTRMEVQVYRAARVEVSVALKGFRGREGLVADSIAGLVRRRYRGSAPLEAVTVVLTERTPSPGGWRVERGRYTYPISIGS